MPSRRRPGGRPTADEGNTARMKGRTRFGGGAPTTDPLGWMDWTGWAAAGWAGVPLQALGVAAMAVQGRWDAVAVLSAFALGATGVMLVRSAITPFLAMLLVVAACGNAAGWVWDLYGRFWWFDDLLHLSTPFALVAALLIAAERLALAAIPSEWWRAALAGAGMAALIGLGWEAAEAIFLDLGWRDTLVDLTLDIAGGALAGAFAGARLRPKAQTNR